MKHKVDKPLTISRRARAMNYESNENTLEENVSPSTPATQTCVKVCNLQEPDYTISKIDMALIQRLMKIFNLVKLGVEFLLRRMI